jgi:hypothetical protein
MTNLIKLRDLDPGTARGILDQGIAFKMDPLSLRAG